MLASEPSPPSVARVVAAFWTFIGGASAHRVLPDGSIDFLFDLERGTATVVGPMRSARVFRLGATTRVFGVRFVPGAASAYVDVEATALLDTAAPLGELTRARSFRLVERVLEARSNSERAGLVTSFLLERPARLRPLEPRVQAAVARLAGMGESVRAVADAVGVGQRQLERLFHERVGVAPKLWARIARLQRALELAERQPGSYAEFARRAGYTDESHLARDCRDLAGTTPRILFGARNVGFVQCESLDAG